MKILYYGGQKSGKSYIAEQKTLCLANSTKPYYIATYDDSYNDKEMAERIELHQSQRKEKFITIEEPIDLASVVKEGHTYLIDCMSMWLLNTMDSKEYDILTALDKISKIDANIVFVLNDVGSGVIPLDAMSRKYVDRSGIVGQKLAQLCDEVYDVKLGLEIKLK